MGKYSESIYPEPMVTFKEKLKDPAYLNALYCYDKEPWGLSRVAAALIEEIAELRGIQLTNGVKNV